MSKQHFTSPHRGLKAFKIVGFAFLVIYLMSMFIVPAFRENFDWQRIQGVWNQWQSLNVGMLAFLSSLIAFGISRFNAEEQRKREFVAERSFLPEAFSELTSYCEASMRVFDVAWRRASDPSDDCNTPLEMAQPELPDSFREVFKACIRVANPEFGDLLSRLLVKLQVHHSRMNALFLEFQDNRTLILPGNVVTYLYRIAEIQAVINKNFEFARGTKDAEWNSELIWEDYRSALSVNNVEIGEIDDLEGFIKRAIHRGSKYD